MQRPVASGPLPVHAKPPARRHCEPGRIPSPAPRRPREPRPKRRNAAPLRAPLLHSAHHAARRHRHAARRKRLRRRRSRQHRWTVGEQPSIPVAGPSRGTTSLSSSTTGGGARDQRSTAPQSAPAYRPARGPTPRSTVHARQPPAGVHVLPLNVLDQSRATAGSDNSRTARAVRGDRPTAPRANVAPQPPARTRRPHQERLPHAVLANRGRRVRELGPQGPPALVGVWPHGVARKRSDHVEGISTARQQFLHVRSEGPPVPRSTEPAPKPARGACGQRRRLVAGIERESHPACEY